jgi:hypothetical protein
MSKETHILTIKSTLDDMTLYLIPAEEPGTVEVRIRIDDRFGALQCRVHADALLIAATSIHARVNGITPP